jgi:predicted transcriptional regulator
MKVQELVDKLSLTVYSGNAGLDNDITGGYVSDLLSDVMGNSEEGQVWITLQNHKNVMAVASLKELSAVILVKGYMPDEATMSHSNEEKVPILGTSAETYETAGALYKLLNP